MAGALAIPRLHTDFAGVLVGVELVCGAVVAAETLFTAGSETAGLQAEPARKTAVSKKVVTTNNFMSTSCHEARAPHHLSLRFRLGWIEPSPP